MWNLKNDTKELIYETKTDTQTSKTDFWLPKGKSQGKDKFRGWEVGINIYTPLYTMYSQQGPTVLCKVSAHSCVITYTGKKKQNCKTMEIYVTESIFYIPETKNIVNQLYPNIKER